MRILVTGSDGMLGKAFRHVSKEYPQFEFVFSTRKDTDLTNSDQVKSMYSAHNPDYVVHTAALCGGIGGNERRQADYYYQNILMNSYIIHFASEFGVKKLLASSSTCVFPRDLDSFVESDMHLGPPHDNHFAYAYAKRMLDVQMLAYKRQYGVNYASLVSGNVFGPHDNYDLADGHVTPSLMHKFYLASAQNTNVSIWGDGSAEREFIYSFDLARIYLELLELDDVLPSKILLGSDNKMKINDLVNHMKEISNFKNEIVFDPTQTNGQIKKKSDISLLKSLLPDFKYTDFRESLSDSYEWFRSNYPNVRGIR
jgi:GDP-L-fucose synthase